MVDKHKVIELQDKVVLCFANSIKVPWDFLLVNFERELIDSEPTEDCLAVLFTRENGNWKRSSIQPPYHSYGLFVEMSEVMANDGKGMWNSCTLEVDSCGKYRYSFSYEQPKRLNGVFDEEALFTDYIPQAL